VLGTTATLLPGVPQICSERPVPWAAVAGISVTDLAGRVIAGRYRLLAPIGTGASGRVYLAEDTRLRRRVAVKVLHGALADDAAFLRRFRAEAQVAAALTHPHIVTVHDWGDDDVPYMVLELLAGGSLRAMLDRGNRLSTAQAAWIGRDVASALDYAHARGIVHRDMKPANLLFDEHGIVHMADFGLARALAEASWTEPAGGLLGTARYASPEQATGATLDARSDLYSLAVVLVEAVTGRVPFGADTALGTLTARTQRPLAAPDEMGPLRAVVERAGRIDPAERYPDAATMRAALADVVESLPRPAPLVLPGASDQADPHPTRAAPSARLFDQDAADEAVVVDTDDARPAGAGRPGGRRLVPFVVAAAIVLALAGAAAGLTRWSTPALRDVPGLVGRGEDAAGALARRAGLTVDVAERRASDDPAGVVLSQDPPAGERLGDGRAVRLVVSSGPRPVTVPDVANAPVEDAVAALREQGLVVVVRRAFHETVAAERVVAQSVPAGRDVAPETAVTLVVSRGPAPVEVPDVHGSTYDEAAQVLADAKLTATRTEEHSNDVEEGLVIRTEPAAGSEAARDSEVVVVVSLGPDLVEVPRVIGMTLDEASARLEADGFVAEVGGRYRPGDRVSRQDPAAESMVPRGSVVTLRF
jgi:serine/threonine-protein kinase